MTNRNRPRARTTRRRSGRNVWVNEVIAPAAISPDTSTSISLLTSAKEFMTFDTTILRVVVTDFSFTLQKSGGNGIVTARYALQIAPTTTDTDDFASLFVSTIGAPWMYTSGVTGFLADTLLTTFTFPQGEDAPIKAKRRFRENDSTLFMIFANTVQTGSFTAGVIRGMIRTLIHIP